MNWEDKNGIPFRIEKNVPINPVGRGRPNDKSRKIKILFSEMEVGESFFVPDLPYLPSIKRKDHVSKALVYRVAQDMGLTFTSRVDEVDGVRGRRYWKVGP